MGRRGATIACLLMTAIMLLCLPRGFFWLLGQGRSRVDDSLKPKQAELITLWLLGDDTNSLKTIKRLLADFEKENRTLRVLLRKADISELDAKNAAKPDALLFSQGMLTQPQTYLIPLDALYGCREDAALCGRLDQTQAALPLWYTPYLLAVDASLLGSGQPRMTPTPEPILPLLPAVEPTHEPTPAPMDEQALWQALIGQGAIAKPKGVALLQLLSTCPQSLRGALIHKPLTGELARCLPYREALRKENARLFALTPAASDSILMMGLCSDAAKGRKLLSYFLSEQAQATLWQDGLFGARQNAALPNEAGLQALYSRGVILANAFAMTQSEREAYCQAAFSSENDPVLSLMRLR